MAALAMSSWLRGSSMKITLHPAATPDCAIRSGARLWPSSPVFTINKVGFSATFPSFPLTTPDNTPVSLNLWLVRLSKFLVTHASDRARDAF